MYPRNYTSPPFNHQRREDQRRQQNSAPPSRIVCAMPPNNRNEATINTFQHLPSYPMHHPSSPSWYYVGPKGTAINNHYENGIVRLTAPPVAAAPYFYPSNNSYIPSSSMTSNYGYPQQLWQPSPPFGGPNRSVYYYHQPPGPTVSTKNTYQPSLQAIAEPNIPNEKQKKTTANASACNCFLISLCVSITTLLICFAILVTYIVTQPTFLQFDYPSEPQKPQQTSTQGKSQQQSSLLNNQVQLTQDDFTQAFADKTRTLSPAVSPVAVSHTSMPQSSKVNDYHDFIEAFQGSSSSILSAKPTWAPSTGVPKKTTAAPFKDTTTSNSTSNNSSVNEAHAFTTNNTSSGRNNTSSFKDSSEKDPKTKSPVKSTENVSPTSASVNSETSSSRTNITPAPTTNDGYYYYYYYEKPANKKDKSTSSSSTSESTNNITATSTTTSTIDSILSSLLSHNDDAGASTTSSSQRDSQSSKMKNYEPTPTPSPSFTTSSSSSSSQRDSLSTKIKMFEPTSSPSPYSTTTSSSSNSSSRRESQSSKIKMYEPTPTLSPNSLSTSGQQLPGTLLGAVDDDDANVSVYGNAKSTIPCDLLMCDDVANDDGTATDTSYSETGGVTYEYSGNGIFPGPYDTVTMTSGSSTGDQAASNPIEKLVGTPITQNSNNNVGDDGLCLDC